MVQLAYWVGGELEAVGGLFVEIDCAGVLGGDLEGKMMIVCLCFLSVFVSWFVGLVIKLIEKIRWFCWFCWVAGLFIIIFE